jgi:hypothetical protein
MRKAITISVSREMEEYIREACGELTVSEYLRSLVRREQKRREDYRARPVIALRANDVLLMTDALEHIEAAKAILERHDEYHNEYDD